MRLYIGRRIGKVLVFQRNKEGPTVYRAFLGFSGNYFTFGFSPAALRSLSVISVFSQVKLGRFLPKWPP